MASVVSVLSVSEITEHNDTNKLLGCFKHVCVASLVHGRSLVSFQFRLQSLKNKNVWLASLSSVMGRHDSKGVHQNKRG